MTWTYISSIDDDYFVDPGRKEEGPWNVCLMGNNKREFIKEV